VRVVELWRYPVKSLQGERVDAADLTAQGLVGDRRWALFDRETGLGAVAMGVLAVDECREVADGRGQSADDLLIGFLR